MEIIDETLSEKKAKKNYDRVIFLLHGLNNHPHVMQELSKELSDLDFDTVMGTITGHGSEKNSDSARWLNGVAKQYQWLQQQYSEIHFLGYSTGALIYEILCHQRRIEPARTVVHLAPAFETHLDHQKKRLIKLSKIPLALPSFNFPRFRKFRLLPLSYYRALFELQELWRELERPLSPQSLGLWHPKDEMVSSQQLEQLFEQNERPFKLITHKKAEDLWSYNHLIISKSQMGAQAWSQMMTDIKSHITH